MNSSAALAIAAHPDDIEFLMAGTLLMLAAAGYEIHYMNVANGSCGSLIHAPEKLRRMRLEEAKKAAGLLGARFHRPLCEDVEIFYEIGLLRKVAAVIREIRPSILLLPSPQDYMEDHTNTCRLAVTAAFVRSFPNFQTDPETSPVDIETTLYHAMPHGLRDPLRKRVQPGMFVNTGPVQAIKRQALEAHLSQADHLAATQSMESLLKSMEEMSLEIGRMSGVFEHAEGWRRHLHFGFCAEDADPLPEALGEDCRINLEYERRLNEM